VVLGDQRGRLLGFPTANVELGQTVRPARGVYAVRAGVAGEDGRVWHDGVANIGLRPTVGGETDRLEAHLFDFAGDLYGRDIAVQLIDFLRPEKKFDGLAALQAQIGEDCLEARRRLAVPAAAPEMRRAGQR
jgi:riboflavin kinase/FMN adenylyltransferase